MKTAKKMPPAATGGGVKLKPPKATKNGQNRKPGNHKIEVDRLLPHDNGAETSLIESLVAGEVQGDPAPLERARTLVEPLDFYRRGGGRVFEMILQLRDSNRGFTLSTLEGCFQNDPDFDNFQDLFDDLEPVTGQVATHFAKIILEKSIRRKLIHSTHTANAGLFDQAFCVREILDDLNAGIRDVEGRLANAGL